DENGMVIDPMTMVQPVPETPVVEEETYAFDTNGMVIDPMTMVQPVPETPVTENEEIGILAEPPVDSIESLVKTAVEDYEEILNNKNQVQSFLEINGYVDSARFNDELNVAPIDKITEELLTPAIPFSTPIDPLEYDREHLFEQLIKNNGLELEDDSFQLKVNDIAEEAVQESSEMILDPTILEESNHLETLDEKIGLPVEQESSPQKDILTLKFLYALRHQFATRTEGMLQQEVSSVQTTNKQI
ncbi:MAG: hypothetical protein R3Y21_05480, partial [Mycoplasmatota bacterium]